MNRDKTQLTVISLIHSPERKRFFIIFVFVSRVCQVRLVPQDLLDLE